MIRQIKQYIRDIRALYRQENVKNKILLFLIYNRLCIKNILYTQLFKIETHKESILKYTVYYDNFNSFFSMFSEIFIHGIYTHRLKNKKPVIIDCGANIGMATLFFKYYYPTARIICFEPDPDTFKLLKLNVYTNKLENIQLYNCALGDKKSKRMLYSFGAFKGSPGNTLDKRYINFDRIQEHVVDCLPLSSFNFDKIDILKIDVEGAEEQIIRDLADRGVLGNINLINLEYHYNENCTDNHLSGILANLEKYGFRYIINPDFLINDTVTLQECLQQKRYVLILNCFSKNLRID